MVQFKDLIAQASERLVRDHGFSQSGRRFVREDELIRSAWFVAGSKLAGSFRFEVLFDVGIAGVSSFSSRAQLWVVRCDGGKLREVSSLPRVRMELTGTDEDEAVRDAVVAIAAHVGENFLLKHQTADEFYQWVRENALEQLEDPRADNDFWRMHLDPFNVLRRLELAGVYAAYLGKTADAASLEEAALKYATANWMKDYMPAISASIASAGRATSH